MPRSALRPLVAGVLLCVNSTALLALDVTQTQTLPSPSSATPPAADATAPSKGPSDTSPVESTITDLKRYFTVTADLREAYDDNVTTVNTHKLGTTEEIISPSILFSYPMDDSTFDLRYTFGLTYYNRKIGNVTYDQSHEFVARYNHSFSDRFNLDLRDEAGYHEDPSLINNIGTVNREGGFYSNTATAEFSAQWTPLFGTVTSYSNNFVSYEHRAVANDENSDENTISQDFRFAFWPTVTFAVGGIYDNISYEYTDRGFSNYTGNTGLDWQALPSLSLGFRVGGSITEVSQGSSSESPYASANVNWQLGEKSRLIGSYAHTITPSDVTFAQGQESDRLTLNFLYNVTERITTHLEGTYTYSKYSQDFLSGSGIAVNNFTENIVGFDTGATYHYNQYLDFELGYLFSDVSSEQSFRDYTRNQFYVGVRGTY